MSYTNFRQQTFRRTVLGFYRRHGRNHLPWRKTNDPYRILVSEIMLQQTQVDRVIPKYRSFLKKFPTVRALSRAPLSAVLREWQGLGYNRRAKSLHEAAHAIVTQYAGRFPKEKEALIALPGIGPYTAGAVRIFAFNFPDVIIETNIRSAYIHHFFPRSKNVADARILPLIRPPKGKARLWYSALMDYGAHLKKTVPNPSRKSKHHTRQKPFKGSDREIRGAILKALARPRTVTSFLRLPFASDRIRVQVENLIREGLAAKRGRLITLPE